MRDIYDRDPERWMDHTLSQKSQTNRSLANIQHFVFERDEKQSVPDHVAQVMEYIGECVLPFTKREQYVFLEAVLTHLMPIDPKKRSLDTFWVHLFGIETPTYPIKIRKKECIHVDHDMCGVALKRVLRKYKKEWIDFRGLKIMERKMVKELIHSLDIDDWPAREIQRCLMHMNKKVLDYYSISKESIVDLCCHFYMFVWEGKCAASLLPQVSSIVYFVFFLQKVTRV
jgi:hypothetical protein